MPPVPIPRGLTTDPDGARPTAAPWEYPFRDHRTVAEVWADDARAIAHDKLLFALRRSNQLLDEGREDTAPSLTPADLSLHCLDVDQ